MAQPRLVLIEDLLFQGRDLSEIESVELGGLVSGAILVLHFYVEFEFGNSGQSAIKWSLVIYIEDLKIQTKETWRTK